MSVVRRSITSASWNIAANATYLVLMLARSIVLARWLPVEIFGIYVASRAFVEIAAILPGLGMGGAFLHRAQEVESEEQAAAVHFTLKLGLTTLWALAMATLAIVYAGEGNRQALLLITLTTAISHMTETPSLILTRRIVYRRLAGIQVVTGALNLMISLALAWGALQTDNLALALWALLSSHVINTGINVFFLYLWKPVWRPRLAWVPEIARYFLRFGGQKFTADSLLKVIDRVDDLWTNFYLGGAALGFYSRAYTFATYPRELIARPVNRVSLSTYAALTSDRLRLSKAFFRTNALLVRSGFFLGGLLALIAPEFIAILLTPKWLPMLDAFRLMLIFTLLDPLKASLGNLFVAVDRMKFLIYIRVLQLLLLLAGMYIFSLTFQIGITGVTLAVNLMLIVGTGVLYRIARRFVDFSFRKLFLVPSLALTAGLVLGRLSILVPGVLGSDWRTAFTKSLAFCLSYGLILLAMEREETIRMAALVRRTILPANERLNE